MFCWESERLPCAKIIISAPLLLGKQYSVSAFISFTLTLSDGNSISVFVFLTRSLSDILGPALGHAPLFCKSHLHGYLPNWIVYARRADDVCVSGLMLLAKCLTAYVAGADAEHTLCQIVFVFPLHRLHYTSFRATVSGFHPFA